MILCCYKYKRNQICKFDLEKVLSSPSLSRSKKISHLMENQCAKVAVMENRHIHIDTWRDLVQFVLAFIPNACVFLSELFFPFRSESRTETLRNDSILSHSIYMFEQTFWLSVNDIIAIGIVKCEFTKFLSLYSFQIDVKKYFFCHSHAFVVNCCARNCKSVNDDDTQWIAFAWNENKNVLTTFDVDFARRTAIGSRNILQQNLLNVSHHWHACKWRNLLRFAWL